MALNRGDGVSRQDAQSSVLDCQRDVWEGSAFTEETRKSGKKPKHTKSIITADMLEGLKSAEPATVIPDHGMKPTKKQINEQLDAAALKYGLPPKVLKGVAWQESTWNPKASSFDGGHGKGIMQIDDRWHEFAKTDAVWDPKQNIDYGSKFLASLYKKYKSWDKMLLRYNGGSDYPPKIAKHAKNQPWLKHIKTA